MQRFAIIVAIMTGQLVAGTATASWQGRPLAEYLDSLNAIGEQILYSSVLVPPTLRLTSEPAPDFNRAQLAALLREFGLDLVDGSENRLLVVRADVVAEPSPQPVPRQAVPIPEVVVTSSLRRLEYASPSAHTSLGRELAGRVPAASEETLRVTTRLPGVANDGLSARSHVRGGESNEVLFTYDGLRLYEPYHLKDFQTVSTIVNPNAVSTVDYYTGAYPSRYGDRMSGVISVQRREPEKALETELALSFFNASILSMGRFGGEDRGDWLLTARRGNLDLIVDVVDPERGSPDYQDYQAHVGWDFGPQARIGLNLLMSHDKLRLKNPEQGESADADYENTVAWLTWNADWTDALSSAAHIALTHILNRRKGEVVAPGIVAGALQEANDFDVLEIKQDWQWIPRKQWMLSFGATLRKLQATYRFTSTQTIAAPFDTILDNRPRTDRAYDLVPEGSQLAAYTEFRWQPVARMTVDAGLRWDQQTYTSADDDRQFSPRLGVLLQLSDALALRAGWGQYYQAQEINELQVSDGLPEFFPAQRAEHYVLNIQYRLAQDIDIDLSWYDKQFQTVRPRFENLFNTLTLLPELQFDRARIEPRTGRARGAELMFSQGDAETDLLWWFSYSWSRAEDSFVDATAKRGWDQTHSVKGGLSWRWRRWQFSAAGELHTGWPKTELRGELIVQPDGTSALELELGGYNDRRYTNLVRFDARISRDIALRKGTLTAFAEVTNLFNRANPCCTEYSVSSDGALDAEQKSWLPLLPSLGVVWKF